MDKLRHPKMAVLLQQQQLVVVLQLSILKNRLLQQKLVTWHKPWRRRMAVVGEHVVRVVTVVSFMEDRLA